MASDDDTVSKNFDILIEELRRLNDHRFVRVHNSPLRLIFFQFLRGLAFGFGSIVGATIVVSVVGYILNQMEVVPIIGEWAKELASEILSNAQHIETGQ